VCNCTDALDFLVPFTAIVNQHFKLTNDRSGRQARTSQCVEPASVSAWIGGREQRYAGRGVQPAHALDRPRHTRSIAEIEGIARFPAIRRCDIWVLRQRLLRPELCLLKPARGAMRPGEPHQADDTRPVGAPELLGPRVIGDDTVRVVATRDAGETAASPGPGGRGIHGKLACDQWMALRALTRHA